MKSHVLTIKDNIFKIKARNTNTSYTEKTEKKVFKENIKIDKTDWKNILHVEDIIDYIFNGHDENDFISVMDERIGGILKFLLITTPEAYVYNNGKLECRIFRHSLDRILMRFGISEGNQDELKLFCMTVNDNKIFISKEIFLLFFNHYQQFMMFKNNPINVWSAMIYVNIYPDISLDCIVSPFGRMILKSFDAEMHENYPIFISDPNIMKPSINENEYITLQTFENHMSSLSRYFLSSTKVGERICVEYAFWNFKMNFQQIPGCLFIFINCTLHYCARFMNI